MASVPEKLSRTERKQKTELKAEDLRMKTHLAGVLPLMLLILVCSGGMRLEAASDQVPKLTLMPVPKDVRLGSGHVVIDRSFSFAYASFHDRRLEGSVSRMLRRLSFETGAEINRAPVERTAGAMLVLDVSGPGERVQSIDEDESYSLKVDGRQVLLHAATDVGAIRGLQTFLQLVTVRNREYVLPIVDIDDAPRFRWRGLMLDCARHFEPLPVILRTLDGMEAVKLNVFHWHLSDDQGFRVESKRFPRLQGMGSDGLYYTQEQIREVVTYARSRGIRVVPEFDMPGHIQAWFVGYPKLASGPGPYPLQKNFGLFDTAMDPTRESTYRFLDAFIGEMAALFTDPYFHIGGDESRGKQWLANPRIVAFMKENNLKNPAALQTYFNARLLRIVKKHGKHMAGWGEILHSAFSGVQDLNPLPKDVVVEPWHDAGLLIQGASSGYQMIVSAPYYLNRMYPAEQYYLADPVKTDTILQGLWANTLEAQRYLAGTKDQDTRLSPEQEANVLGGEICMWGELIDPATVDSVIWPRTAAIAERFWSPAAVRNVDDMYRRLWIESLRLEQAGLTHISGPQKMLRDLTGTMTPFELKRLASILEPVGFSDRMRAQHVNQLTPLDGLADAVVPDPPSRHDFSAQVQEFLADPQHRAERARLTSTFQSWQQIAVLLDTLMSESPRLAGIKPRVEQLPDLGRVGLTSLACIADQKIPSPDWRQNALKLLTDLEKPAGLVRFTFVTSLHELVLSCGHRDTAATPSQRQRTPTLNSAHLAPINSLERTNVRAISFRASRVTGVPE